MNHKERKNKALLPAVIGLAAVVAVGVFLTASAANKTAARPMTAGSSALFFLSL